MIRILNDNYKYIIVLYAQFDNVNLQTILSTKFKRLEQAKYMY
jgi:hypothetical protein